MPFHDYYPFGKTLRANITGPKVTTYKFTGKELDDENDLNWYYFGARYYEPEIGRWLIPDPLEQDPGPYSFTTNNPIVFIDEFGLWWMYVYDDEGNVIGRHWIEEPEPTVTASRDESWWEGWGAEYGSPPRGASEYVRRGYYVARTYGLWRYNVWRQQNAVDVETLGNIVTGVSWFAVGGVGIGAASSYGISSSLASKGLTISQYIGAGYETLSYLVSQALGRVAFTGAYYAGYYGAIGVAAGIRYGQQFATELNLATQRFSFFYLRNANIINSFVRGFESGFTPGVPGIEYSRWWMYGYSMGSALSKLFIK